MIARVVEGDAEVFRNGQPGVIRMGLVKKLEGNPEDPISQGKLCARGQAALQITYHPDRLDRPRKRSGERGGGQYVDISWDEAIKELTGQLDRWPAANDQACWRFGTKPRRGRGSELISQLLQRYGAKAPVTYELFSDEVLRRANAISFGAHQLPTFDLEQSRYVVVFGADLLGTWNSPLAQSAAYGRMRQGRAGARAKLVHVDARLSQTAANADEFVAIRPGNRRCARLASRGRSTVPARWRRRPPPARNNLRLRKWSRDGRARGKVESGWRASRRERDPHGGDNRGAPLAHRNGCSPPFASNTQARRRQPE